MGERGRNVVPEAEVFATFPGLLSGSSRPSCHPVQGAFTPFWLKPRALDRYLPRSRAYNPAYSAAVRDQLNLPARSIAR